jgi:hypothetical protein
VKETTSTPPRKGRRWLRVAIIGAAAAGILTPFAVHSAEAEETGGVPAAQDAEEPGAAAQAAAAKPPKEGDIKGHRRILIVKYHVTGNCVIHANYPNNHAAPNGKRTTWSVPAGKTIYWRYNVTSKVAAISDPNVSDFPHWGFVEDRGCIGTSTGQTGSYQIFHKGKWEKRTVKYPAGKPVPNRILSGRSQFKPFWRAVDWHPSHGAVPSKSRKMKHNGTLRDAANRFVIGNVYKGWTVKPTGSHSGGMTKVYVPALHRWGWLQV